MFFGGNDKPETVNLADLERLLNVSFDNKLGRLDSRGSSITEEMKSALERFGEECRRFEEIEDNPYTEDLYVANVNFIKGQKKSYAKALAKISESVDLGGIDAENLYGKYELVLSKVNAAIESMLHTNASFKLVVYSYSSYMKGFKRAISQIEQLRDSLKEELRRNERELSEYKTVKEEILGLKSELADLENERGRIASLSASSTHPEPQGSGEADFLAGIKAKSEELAAIATESNRLYSRISYLTLPLEKPSRKADHLSPRKQKLNPMLIEPIDDIADEEAYKQFLVLVKELGEGIASGRVEVRNKGEALSEVKALLNSDLYSLITSFRQCTKRRSETEHEIRGLEGRLNSVSSAKKALERSAEELADSETRAKELEVAIHKREASTESLFRQHYKKRITIEQG